jgi:hypothetical protein
MPYRHRASNRRLRGYAAWWRPTSRASRIARNVRVNLIASLDWA